LGDHVRFVHQKSKGAFLCQECGKSFSYQRSLSQHELAHKTTPSRRCKSCKKIFPTAEKLNEHSLNCCVKHYVCDVCDRGFRKVGDLSRHKFSHKTFFCVVCKTTLKGSKVKHFHQRHSSFVFS
jgi:hypothetical protein